MILPDDEPDLHANDYKGLTGSRQGRSFQSWSKKGSTSIPVLHFLNGKPWNDAALGFVHALRPSRIRVTENMLQCDAQVWRVTVFINSEGMIQKISQEVEVGLPDQCEDGWALQDAIEYGLDSEQVKWHQIPGTVHFIAIPGHEETFKSDDDGKRIPYPRPIPKE